MRTPVLAVVLAGCVPVAETRDPAALAALGEWLFFEPGLSADGTVSCATCHDPERAFTDGLARPVGVDGAVLARNTPSLLNVGRLAPLTWAHPGLYALEDQAMLPLYDPLEMGATPESVVAAIPSDLHLAAFGPVPIRAEHARLGLAAYQRTIVALDTPYDRWLAGEADLGADAARGLERFEALACVDCHAGPLLTVADAELAPTIDVFQRNTPLGELGDDGGLYEHTADAADLGRFRVPSLRGVTRTAPYFHDGRYATLDDVLDHYDRVQRLGLTEDDRLGLLAFFATLAPAE